MLHDKTNPDCGCDECNWECMKDDPDGILILLAEKLTGRGMNVAEARKWVYEKLVK